MFPFCTLFFLIVLSLFKAIKTADRIFGVVRNIKGHSAPYIHVAN